MAGIRRTGEEWAALTDAYKRAHQRHEVARVEYRAGRMTDDEYLTVRRERDDAMDALDEAEAVRAHGPGTCPGCGERRILRPYQAAFAGGPLEPVAYCDDCADQAWAVAGTGSYGAASSDCDEIVPVLTDPFEQRVYADVGADLPGDRRAWVARRSMMEG